MSAQPAALTSSARPLRLGFLGLGWIGRQRLDAIASVPGVQIAAIADTDAIRVQAARQQYHDAVAVHGVESLLDCDLDGVIIATPNGVHAQQAIACLSRGLAVFCQKPLATHARDAIRIIEAARRADRLLGVDLCYRYVDGMHELRRRIISGQLGTIAAVDLTFHNAYGPDKSWCLNRELAGGGCLLDLGVHLIDLALWLQGHPETRLLGAQLFKHAKRLGVDDLTGDESTGDELEDLAYADFCQSNGAHMRIACSWHAHTGRDAVIEMRICGSEGGATWRNIEGSFYDFELEVHRGTSREKLGGYPDAWGDRALRAWIDRLAHDRCWDPQAAEYLHTAKLIDAVYGR
jgi:predicted dehydrogenase